MVAVGCLNLQIVGNDVWHHQVIYGVDVVEWKIFCLNPCCEYSEDLTTRFVSTPSVICVRKEDVLLRVGRGGADESIYAAVVEAVYG